MKRPRATPHGDGQREKRGLYRARRRHRVQLQAIAKVRNSPQTPLGRPSYLIRFNNYGHSSGSFVLGRHPLARREKQGPAAYGPRGCPDRAGCQKIRGLGRQTRSAALSMRRDRSFSAALSRSFSDSVKSPSPPLLLRPSSFWCSHERLRPK